MATDEQTEAVFKSSRTGYALGGEVGEAPDTTVGVDPVSGNEVPMGAMPEEVRDDIPAQLSEGEYIVPADVVRFYGIKFFEDLRTQAKTGYQEMEQNGRIGGEDLGPEGMEMVEPEDDLPFDISELQTVEAAEGAYIRGYDEGGFEVGDPLVNQGIDDLFTMPVTPTNREQRQYVGPNGEMMLLTFIDGKPDATAQAMIDLGYKPEGEQQETPTVEAPTAEPLVQDNPSANDDGNNYDLDKFMKEQEAVEDAAPRFAGKTAQELIAYGDKLVDGKSSKALKGVVGLNPLVGGLASAARRAEIFNVAKGLKEKFLETVPGSEESKQIDEAFQRITSRGKETGSGVLGGGGLLGGGGVLRDVDGDGEVNFGDTWLGDLLGFDKNGSGIQGPKQSDSFNGARRVGGTGKLSYRSLSEFYSDPNVSHALGTGKKLTGSRTKPQLSTYQKQMKAGNYEGATKTAVSNWQNATAAVNAASASDDPVAWSKAIKAQSEASKAATKAIRARTGSKGFFDRGNKNKKTKNKSGGGGGGK